MISKEWSILLAITFSHNLLAPPKAKKTVRVSFASGREVVEIERHESDTEPAAETAVSFLLQLEHCIQELEQDIKGILQSNASDATEMLRIDNIIVSSMRAYMHLSKSLQHKIMYETEEIMNLKDRLDDTIEKWQILAEAFQSVWEEHIDEIETQDKQTKLEELAQAEAKLIRINTRIALLERSQQKRPLGFVNGCIRALRGQVIALTAEIARLRGP